MKKITLFSLLVMAVGIITAQTNWTLNGATWEKNITPDILKFESKTTAQMQDNIFTIAGGANPSTAKLPIGDPKIVNGYIALAGSQGSGPSYLIDPAVVRPGFNIVNETVAGETGTFLRWAQNGYAGELSNDISGNPGTKSGAVAGLWANMNIWFPSKYVHFGLPYKLKFTYEINIAQKLKAQLSPYASATTLGTAGVIPGSDFTAVAVGGVWKTISWEQGTAAIPMTMRFENMFDGAQLLYFKTPTFLLYSSTEPVVRTITVTDTGAGVTTAEHATVRDLDQQVFTFTPGSEQTLVSVTYNGTDVTAQVSGGKFTTPILTADATLSVVYSNKPTWIGQSLVAIGGSAGTWYKCSATSSHAAFQGVALGDLASLTLGGETQVLPQQTEAARMGYTIDGGAVTYIDLPKTGIVGNNTKHYGEGVIDISALSVGTHTLAVWFEAGVSPDVVYDSNLSANYVATFKKTSTGVKNQNITNVKLSTTGNLLSINDVSKGDRISVYSVSGKTIYSAMAVANSVSLQLDKGVYLVKVNETILKVIM